VDGLRVGDEYRDAHRGARDPQLRQVKDLAALGDDLPLFLRVAVVEEDVDLGQRVERNRMGIDRWLLRLTGDMCPDLALELRDRVRARPRDRLVRVDDDPLDADAVPQRHQDRNELHGGAVGVGDDPLVTLEVVRVHLRDDERHRLVHPPRTRVVDHGRASSSCLGRKLL
jgi:hypothetical protein